MNRTKNSISQRAHVLDVQAEYHYWSEDDIKVLHDAYLTHDRNYCYQLFPNRTKSSITSLLNTFSDINKRINPNYIWSDDEISELINLYAEDGRISSRIKEKFSNHNQDAIRKKCKELDLNTSYNLSWTEEMDNMLKQGKEITNKSPKMCLARCRYLNIYHSIYRPNTHFWTKEEDDILKQYYSTEGSNVSFRLKSRSDACCVARASKLGLKYENKKDAIKSMISKTSKKILCIETNEIFNSASEAIRIKGIKNIDAAARAYSSGKNKYAGKLPDGTKLHWKYIEEE